MSNNLFVEFVKLLALISLVILCIASWYVDPFSPKDSGPAGYLGIDPSYEFDGRSYCRRIESTEEYAVCKAAKSNERVIPDPNGGAHGALMSFLLKAGGGASRGGTTIRNGESSFCVSSKKKIDSCRSEARFVQEKVQLKCYREVRDGSVFNFAESVCNLARSFLSLPRYCSGGRAPRLPRNQYVLFSYA
jgi:hypothetical protein